MVQFTKLRVTGFKSFVEPAELLIEPGVTGIVGPNGCGKSNLLEALRWCMGEASAKQLRGGGMDDVIFSGSRERPARNIAEVMVHIDNRDRTAAGLFSDHDELEIVRRIERDSGSSYKVNGKEQRARDVQLLFADLSTGARSTAIVRQGRIEALINAKPTDRRMLLEEAAGITGLHSRRHEAELRLRAAETNLERLEDVVVALESQLQGLKRQVRQANRYRNLSDHIRRAEAVQLHLQWIAAADELRAAREGLQKVESEVAHHTRQAAAASTELAEAAAALPGVRKAEAEAAAELQRAIVARENLDAEQARLDAQRQECEIRLAQSDADMAREREFQAEARNALHRLAEEESALRRAQKGEEEAEREAGIRAEAIAAEVRRLDEESTALTQSVAAGEARGSALTRQIAELEDRLTRLHDEAERAAMERAALEARADGDEADRARRAVSEAAELLNGARASAEAAEDTRTAAQAAEAEAQTRRQAADDALSRLRAEEAGLAAVLADDGDGDFPPLLDGIKVAPGYEAALGAAFGEDLGASLDAGSPLHWGHPPALGEVFPLPEGAEPLSRYVTAPPELSRRLEQIGVVADESAARPLLKRLIQGQRLVTRTGAMWRWDGLTVAAGAPTAAVTRLGQQNRLRKLKDEIDAAQTTVAAAEAALADAKAKSAAAVRAEKAASGAVREAFGALDAAREAQTGALDASSARRSRLDLLRETIERLQQEIAVAESQRTEAHAARADLADPAGDRDRLVALREALGRNREALTEAGQLHSRLAAEAEARRHRLSALAAERKSWSGRAENGDRHIAQLEERRAVIEAERQRLAALPAEIESRKGALIEAIEAAEARRRETADRLAEAEAALAEVENRLKSAERQLADAREARGRCEGRVAQAEQSRATVAERIHERLRCAPEAALALAEIKDGEPLPDRDAIDRKVERLLRERDNMGPVNLRAEQEARDLEEQIETYTSERADLLAAIDKFRKAIADLNKEGRERLLASFETVNSHFKGLFARLYGGGRAHLELSEADDPLDAGLEVMASPPGKRLQSLSLLSGGEKALTALALVFAVFLTNPAPICVLDEVDAPLDDSNVDRFCNLVHDMAAGTNTRFMIVTHHRMTMARADRLYGVTMAEQGISQLVSVDLQEAEALRETA